MWIDFFVLDGVSYIALYDGNYLIEAWHAKDLFPLPSV